MVSLACILVNYRNPYDTLECLKSLRQYGKEGLKVFLINNFNADGSGKLFLDYFQESGMDAVYLDPGANTGFAGGSNLGIRAAMAENFGHIMLLNNDCVVAEEFGSAVSQHIAAHPNEVLAGQVLDYVTGEPSFNIGTISPWIGQIRHILKPDYQGEIDFVSGCLMIVPRKVFEQVGLFDESLFMYCEDADFCFRLKANSIPIRYCPAIIVRHRFSASVTKSGTPKEYYIMRNQTYIVLRRASLSQRFFYLFFLLMMPFYKIVRRPTLFRQAIWGTWDGIWGKMGMRNST